MKTVQVKIKGLSPLLMHRFGEEEQAKVASGGGAVSSIPTRELAAERAAYRIPAADDKGGNLCIPGENLRQALVSASTYEKGKRGSSLAKFAAAAIFIKEVCLDLGTDKYEIDSRPVVIQATKGRIIRHRPILRGWEVEFALEYDETLLSEEQMRRIVDHCGSKIGLLDFRPAKRGPFGRFVVMEWKNSEA